MKNKELLLVPGPTPVIDEIYDALASETRGHTDARFVEIYKRAIENTKTLLNTDGEVFIIAGSGTLAMEMAIVNTIAPEERVLVISNGYFGDRFQQLAKAFQIHVDILQAEWGKSVSSEEVQDKLVSNTYKAVTITHADTSTGVAANLEELIPIIKATGALVILDGVVATAALQEDMGKGYGGNDDYKIDIVLTGSQKAIGVPPGLAIVAFSPKALKVRENLGQINAYFTDIENWRPIMENPAKYFATPPVNLIYAYDRAIEIVLSEGIVKRETRHIRFGKAIRAALQSFNLQSLADESVAAPTLSCILYPEGVEDVAFRSGLAKRGIIVAGSLAHLAGKAFRIGHMGNTTVEQLEIAVRAIGETLEELGQSVDIERAIMILNEEIK